MQLSSNEVFAEIVEIGLDMEQLEELVLICFVAIGGVEHNAASRLVFSDLAITVRMRKSWGFRGIHAITSL